MHRLTQFFPAQSLGTCRWSMLYSSLGDSLHFCKNADCLGFPEDQVRIRWVNVFCPFHYHSFWLMLPPPPPSCFVYIFLSESSYLPHWVCFQTWPGWYTWYSISQIFFLCRQILIVKVHKRIAAMNLSGGKVGRARWCMSCGSETPTVT